MRYCCAKALNCLTENTNCFSYCSLTIVHNQLFHFFHFTLNFHWFLVSWGVQDDLHFQVFHNVLGNAYITVVLLIAISPKSMFNVSKTSMRFILPVSQNFIQNRRSQQNIFLNVRLSI